MTEYRIEQDERFTYFGTCNCNGGLTRKYKCGAYVVYVGNSSFRVKKNGTTIKQRTHINELEKYLSYIPALSD